MNRARALKALSILSVFLLISAECLACGSRGFKSKARAYKPEVKEYSDSLIIEGSIRAVDSHRIIIKTRRGSSLPLEIDDATAVFESGELVSIATMGDIALSHSDLKIFDSVEVVIERRGQRQIARIITRTSSGEAQVAKRN